MANTKEIRTKIASIQSTQKITSAMEMVAASKMRKVQDNMEASRPYADNMKKVISHVSGGTLEYSIRICKREKLSGLLTSLSLQTEAYVAV